MKTNIISTKIIATLSAFSLVFMPIQYAGAISTTDGGLSANVTTQSSQIMVNSVTVVKNSGTPDGTFENGWKWIFDITIPIYNESNLMMKFDNWSGLGFSGNSLPVANNMRFYSAQSSNASSANNAIYITAPNTYSSSMFLFGNLDNTQASRRVQITVEARIPGGTQSDSYSTTFGIKTQ